MEWMHMLKVYYIRVYTTMKGLIEGLERLPNMRTALSSTSCTGGGGEGGEEESWPRPVLQTSPQPLERPRQKEHKFSACLAPE